jgi:glycosyltransferase involved in cell wall biosynthesis/2-polyprenyl-3-methyl-5-hydroxy-6-metoxy-1,4-benzoquinol methylase
MSTILEQGGGLEKYLIESASNLAQDSNIQADVVTLDEKFTLKINNILTFYYLSRIGGKSIKRETTDSVKQKLGKANYINVSTMAELKDVLSTYDVIYSKNEILEAFILKYFIGFKNLPPVIFGVHTPHYYPITNSIQSKVHNLLYCSKFYNFLCKEVKAFHVSNKQSHEILSKQFKNKNIYLVYYPFDTDKFANLRTEFKTDIEINPTKTNILWLARLSNQKGIEQLVEVVTELNKKYSNKIDWHIAGSGDLKYELMIQDLAQSHGNVVFHGHIPNKHVPDLLSKIDIFLSTSNWEVSPYNVLEAQSLNKYVVANNIPGPADIIVQPKTGLLCKNTDEMLSSLEELINTNIFRQNDNSISSSIKARFDPSVIFPKFKDMLVDVVETTKASSRDSDSSWYDSHYYNTKEQKINPWYKRLYENFKFYNVEELRILDNGCGSGLGLLPFVQKGIKPFNIYGVDQSAKAIDQAKINIPQGNFLKGDSYNLPYQSDFFDSVLLMEVLEHFEHPLDALEEIYRVLKPEGYLYLSFPNYYNFTWLAVRLLSEWLNKPNWIMLQPIDKIYTSTKVIEMCKTVKLNFLEIHGSVFFPPVIYTRESSKFTNVLNKMRLGHLAFHPVLIFKK